MVTRHLDSYIMLLSIEGVPLACLGSSCCSSGPKAGGTPQIDSNRI